MNEIITSIAHFFMSFGYLGIFIMMTLEASFIPFPSEVALLPAGYLIGTGEMNFIAVLIAGTLGSIVGSLLNYFLGKSLGRYFLLKYGKYFFLDENKLNRMEKLFNRKGEIIIFLGRFIPVVRQYISFPAGILEMNIFRFIIFTGLGSFIYVTFMVKIGKFYKEYEYIINNYIIKYRYIIISFLIIFILYKIYKYKINR